MEVQPSELHKNWNANPRGGGGLEPGVLVFMRYEKKDTVIFKTVAQRENFKKYSNICHKFAFLPVNLLCFCIFKTLPLSYNLQNYTPNSPFQELQFDI